MRVTFPCDGRVTLELYSDGVQQVSALSFPIGSELIVQYRK